MCTKFCVLLFLDWSKKLPMTATAYYDLATKTEDNYNLFIKSVFTVEVYRHLGKCSISFNFCNILFCKLKVFLVFWWVCKKYCFLFILWKIFFSSLFLLIRGYFRTVFLLKVIYIKCSNFFFWLKVILNVQTFFWLKATLSFRKKTFFQNNRTKNFRVFLYGLRPPYLEVSTIFGRVCKK